MFNIIKKNGMIDRRSVLYRIMMERIVTSMHEEYMRALLAKGVCG